MDYPDAMMRGGARCHSGTPDKICGGTSGPILRENLRYPGFLLQKESFGKWLCMETVDPLIERSWRGFGMDESSIKIPF